LGFAGEIVQPEVETAKLLAAEKVIMSGGPSSVYEVDLKANRAIIEAAAAGRYKSPLLGICFGQQAIAHVLGGSVAKGKSAEYGTMEIAIDKPQGVLVGLPGKITAWVSHFDEVKSLPPNFISLAHSQVCPFEAMMHTSLPIHAVQFHPEVWHTQYGEKILENFLRL